MKLYNIITVYEYNSSTAVVHNCLTAKDFTSFTIKFSFTAV